MNTFLAQGNYVSQTGIEPRQPTDLHAGVLSNSRLASEEQLVAELQNGSFAGATAEVDISVIDYFAAHEARLKVPVDSTSPLAKSVLMCTAVFDATVTGTTPELLVG